MKRRPPALQSLNAAATALLSGPRRVLPEKFTAEVRQYVKNVAAGLMRKGNYPFTADDAAQEAMLKLHKCFPTLRSKQMAADRRRRPLS